MAIAKYNCRLTVITIRLQVNNTPAGTKSKPNRLKPHKQQKNVGRAQEEYGNGDYDYLDEVGSLKIDFRQRNLSDGPWPVA